MEKLGQRQSQTNNEYFIGIVPPPPIYEETLQLKEYFRDRYGSKASLNSPPHITLHMPFRWPAKKEPILFERLDGFFSEMTCFRLALTNFSSFPPRVIFVDVEPNEALVRLQRELTVFCKKSLNLFNANYRELPFHPHLTLAFRDLKKPKYEEAWNEFSQKDYHADFTVRNSTLLKHDGKMWRTHKQFHLKDATVR